MLSKLLHYHKKIGKVVFFIIRIMSVEVIKIHLFAIAFLMVMLMVIHLVFTGEFGFCYWSIKGGWIWS